MLDFSPAFFKQRSTLNFNIIPFVFHRIMQGSVNPACDNINFSTIIDPCIPASFINLGSFGDIIMIRIFIKVIQSIYNIIFRIIFKFTGQITVEMDPIFTLKEEYAYADQICNEFIVIRMIQLRKLFFVFLPLSDDFFHQMI